MASAPPPPETSFVTTTRVACDGGIGVNPALGHPRVFLQIDERGYVDCGYCDRRFILKGSPAEHDQNVLKAPDSHSR